MGDGVVAGGAGFETAMPSWLVLVLRLGGTCDGVVFGGSAGSRRVRVCSRYG